MQLNTELNFKGSRKSKISVEFDPEDSAQDKLSLGLKAMLTPSVAEALGCSYVYQSGSVAQDSLKQLCLDGTLVDVELKLKGEESELDTIYPESIGGFVLYKAGAAQIGISMTVQATGNFWPVLEFFNEHRMENFEFRIQSLQGQLFEGGTRVEMSVPEEPAEPEGEADRSYENRPRVKRGKAAAQETLTAVN